MRANNVNKRRVVRELLVLTVVFAVAVWGCILLAPKQQVHAGAIGLYQPLRDNVHLNSRAMYPFRQMKTLDLSESDIEITLTEAQKTTLKKQAREEVEDDLNVVKNYLVKKGWMNQDGTYKGAEINDAPIEDFLEDKADGDVQKSNELHQAKLFLLEGMGYKFGWYSSDLLYLNDWKYVGTVYDSAGYVWAEDANKFAAQWSAYLKNNAAEKFNELQSDALTKQMREKLQVKFDFDLVALEDSEKEAYGVDGEQVMAGKFKGGKKSVSFSEVDFGAKNQFYDEILDYIMDALVGEYREEYDSCKRIIDLDYFNAANYPNDYPGMSEEIEALYKALADKFGLDYKVETVNGRKKLEIVKFPEQHIWTRDSGMLQSSDDSQFSWNMPVDDAEWPGWHSLLEVADSMSTYCVLRPCWSYTDTFNLRLNPAVTYIFNVGNDVDFVTDVKTDSNGRVTSISKPLHMNADLKKLHNKIDGDNGDHIYRFKLVESSVYPKSLGNNDFVENKEVKVCDVQLFDDEQGARVWIYDDMKDVADMEKAGQDADLYEEGQYPEELVSHATFTNKLVKKPNSDSATDKGNVNGNQGSSVTSGNDEDGGSKVDYVDSDSDNDSDSSSGSKTSGVRTGDFSNPWLWSCLAGISLLVVIVLVVRRRRA